MVESSPDSFPGQGRPRGGLLREEVYGLIRDRIVSLELQPGERVRDSDLAKELGVSRTPVREALRRLEDEGLVETNLNRWTKVATIDLGEAERLYPIVWALEKLAITEVDTISAKLVLDLKLANDRLSAALDEDDAGEASDADKLFHEELIGAWGNPAARRIHDDLRMRLQRIEIHYFSGSLPGRKSLAEHQAVIDALATGDRVGAAEAVERNWRNSLGRLRARVTAT